MEGNGRSQDYSSQGNNFPDQRSKPRLGTGFQWSPTTTSQTVDIPRSYVQNLPLSTSTTTNHTSATNKDWNYFEDGFARSVIPAGMTGMSENSFNEETSSISPSMRTTQHSEYNVGLDNFQTASQLAQSQWTWPPSTSTSTLLQTPLSFESTPTEMPLSPMKTEAPPQQPKKANNASSRTGSKKPKTKTNSSPPKSSTARPRSWQSSSKSKQPQTTPKLRTAQTSRRSSTTSTTSKSSPSSDITMMDKNRSHNEVEKQYRQRLNSHFAALLLKIPKDVLEASGIDTGTQVRNVSKAETLILAEQYIKRLQTDERELSERNQALVEQYERLKVEWVKLGGIVMP